MEMLVHLHPEVFEIVANGVKDVEVRVNDEKRRRLHVGDTLVFLKRPEEIEKLYAKVTNLVYFNSFEEVVDAYDMKKIYLDNTSKEEYINLMKRFYSDEEVKEYGVVAIEFELEK
ncbi:MAG: ASCH domain-containing protein [Bacilli bacterium]|nr:ASCH domain-containing protein [Bacilli bacterium]